VFLDEPTAGVDIALRRDLWSYVRTLREGGTTIVLTTHYLEEAEALADRVAVIDQGQLVTVDHPAALLRQQGRKRAHFRFAHALTAPLPDELTALGAILDEDNRGLVCPLPEPDVGVLLQRVSTLAPISDVTTSQPSLEDVFMALTGGRRRAAKKVAP
jgi:ABC-2 type transport system ATP-binding protein